jgi:signal recognition particle GTPase
MLLKCAITLDDFARQLDRLLQLDDPTAALPFLGVRDLFPAATEWKQELRRMRSIIAAMTPAERRDPDHLDIDQILRIALVSDTKPKDVGDFLRQFGDLRAQLAQVLTSGKLV